MALTREQFQELRDKGLSVEQIVAFESGQAPQIQTQPQKGFLRSIVEDPIKTLVVKPGVRFGQAIGATIAGAVGVPEERIQQAISQDTQFLGMNIEGQKGLGEGGGKQILGDIAKTGSYLYTGGTGLGVKELLKTGAIGGATYSFGDAIQDAEATPASVAYQTMFGGVAGATTGLLFSGLLKGVSKALDIKSTLGGGADINKVNSKINELNQEVFKPTKTQLRKAGTHDIIKTYTDVFGVDVPQVDANNRFLKESTDEFVAKINELYKPGAEAFNTILRNSPEVVDLSTVKQTVVSNIRKSSLTPNAKQSAIARVEAEYSALLNEARGRGWLRGSKNLPVEFADNFKDSFWGATRNFGTEEASVTNAVNKEFGFAFKNAIESVVQDVNVQDFNRKLGDLITLREFVQDIAGKQAGTGGKMTRLLAGRVAGTIAGSTGGIPGAIIGNLSGDLIAKIMIDPKMQPYRWLLRKRLAQLPSAEVTRLEQEANVVLQKMFERRMARLALPAPTPKGTARNPLITPSPTTFEPQAQNVRREQQALPQLRGGGENPIQLGQSRYQSQSASTNPTNTVNKNPISKTLDQTTKKNNSQAGFVQAYKGEKDLTTKILKDLEGKTTVSKQYILDATNRGELKQVERDLVRRVLDDMSGGEKAYHGTNAKFDVFDVTKRGANEQGHSAKNAFWFSNSKTTAGSYGKTVKEAQIKFDKPITIDAEGKMYGDMRDIIDNTILKAKKNGNDGVIIKNLSDRKDWGNYEPATHFAVLDTKAIKLSSDTINVSDFAKKVKAELLPLKVKKNPSPKDDYASARGEVYGQRYEGITLPSDIRGKVADYVENVYESPIKTSAGKIHFDNDGIDNYFGHTRIEDMADNKTRRVIEVQSDLYQKGNLEREINPPGYPRNIEITSKKGMKEVEARKSEISKLQQYNDPTAHFRMIREEIKKASQDGKTKIQFPTGETAMKIEGLGESTRWRPITNRNVLLKQGDLKVGMSITGDEPGVVGTGEWIITDVLGDGKFKAVPKRLYDDAFEAGGGGMDRMIDANRGQRLRDYQETFDISGKVDTSNPIYKFYEKDVQKYLNKFGGKRIVDDKGVSWIEVPIKKEWGNQAVEAFGMITNSPLFLVAGATGAVAGVRKLMNDKKK